MNVNEDSRLYIESSPEFIKWIRPTGQGDSVLSGDKKVSR